MSVIENALKALKASQGARAPGQPRQVFGSVMPAMSARKREGAPIPEPPARTVTIDQVALRAAGLLPPEHQAEQLARQYRQIKRPLIAKALGRGTAPIPAGNLIMVASAMPGEGKTFMSLNLAFSMRLEKDIRVVLVDGDVANPQISRLLGVDKERGLLDVVRDPSIDIDSVILPTDVSGLSVLPAGRRADNATELLASARMREIAAHLAGRDPLRIALVDSPPLLLTTESHALSEVMGQVVIVVRADQTPQQAVLDAVDHLEEGKPIALVLNQSMHHPTASYYYNTNEASDSPKDP
jgi:protein-tyrosine kinase